MTGSLWHPHRATDSRHRLPCSVKQWLLAFPYALACFLESLRMVGSGNIWVLMMCSPYPFSEAQQTRWSSVMF